MAEVCCTWAQVGPEPWFSEGVQETKSPLSGKSLSFPVLEYVDCLPVGKCTHSQGGQEVLANGSICNHSRISSHSQTHKLHVAINKTRAPKAMSL